MTGLEQERAVFVPTLYCGKGAVLASNRGGEQASIGNLREGRGPGAKCRAGSSSASLQRRMDTRVDDAKVRTLAPNSNGLDKQTVKQAMDGRAHMQVETGE